MATLVTGGTGFIGSNIVKALAQKGHDVVSLDIAPPDRLVRQYLEPWASRIAWAQTDITNPKALKKAASGHKLDKVIHAAVYTATSEDLERSDSKKIIDINFGGTANLLELARQAKVKRFVYVSSGGVYGEGRPPDQPLREDTPLDPRGLYGVTKYASELIVRRYGDLHGMEAATVRISGPYGPMERPTGHRAAMSFMHQWTGQIVRGEAIALAPRGSSGDLTYAMDIAGGIAAVLDAPALHYSLYNLSNGRMVTLGELTEAFKKAVPGVRIAPPPAGASPHTWMGYGRGPLDATRIRQDVGFAPQYDLVKGIREYIEWRRASSYFQ